LVGLFFYDIYMVFFTYVSPHVSLPRSVCWKLR
jgi:hypothetical protein